MMKSTIKFFVVVACVFATFTVSAQTKATRFGYINTEELLATLPEMKKAEEELKKKQQEIEGQMASLQETYQKLLKELNEGAKAMTDLEKVSKEQELQGVIERIKRFEVTAQEMFAKAQQDLVAPIFTKVRNAIKAVGDENGFSYILDAKNLLYVAPTAENVLPLVKRKLGVQ